MRVGMGCDGYVASASIAGTPQATTAVSTMYEPNMEVLAQAKEMIYRAAAMRFVSLGSENSDEHQGRLNVRISSDLQTVTAWLRQKRISEHLRLALAPAVVLLEQTEGKEKAVT